jgi:hypothetical protein
VTEPQLVVMGGANGAGKSTLAQAHIPELIAAGSFLNADEVAKRLAPEDQERAAIGKEHRSGAPCVAYVPPIVCDRIHSGQPQLAANRPPGER